MPNQEKAVKERSKSPKPNVGDWRAARSAAVALRQGVVPSILGDVVRMPRGVAPETAAVVRAVSINNTGLLGVGNYFTLRREYSSSQIKGFRTRAASLSSGSLVGRIARYSAGHDHHVSRSELRRLGRGVV